MTGLVPSGATAGRQGCPAAVIRGRLATVPANGASECSELRPPQGHQSRTIGPGGSRRVAVPWTGGFAGRTPRSGKRHGRGLPCCIRQHAAPEAAVPQGGATTVGSLITPRSGRAAAGVPALAAVPRRRACTAGRPAGDDAGWCERPKVKQAVLLAPAADAREHRRQHSTRPGKRHGARRQVPAPDRTLRGDSRIPTLLPDPRQPHHPMRPGAVRVCPRQPDSVSPYVRGCEAASASDPGGTATSGVMHMPSIRLSLSPVRTHLSVFPVAFGGTVIGTKADGDESHRLLDAHLVRRHSRHRRCRTSRTETGLCVIRSPSSVPG